MPDPPDVGNMLFTFVVPTRQEGENKRTHFYLRVKRRSFGSGIAGFMLSGNSCENYKLETCNLKRLGEICLTRNVLSRRTGLFALLFQIDRIR